MSPGKSNPSREILNLIDEMGLELYELQKILLLLTCKNILCSCYDKLRSQDFSVDPLVGTAMAGEYVDVVVDHPGASAIVIRRRWSVEWLRNQSGSRVKPDHCVRIYRRMHHVHRRVSQCSPG